MVRFFNNYNVSFRLNDSDRALVVRGSFDEDAGMRAMHHFYDPVNNKGITIGGEWIHAKQWSEDTLAQATIDPLF